MKKMRAWQAGAAVFTRLRALPVLLALLWLAACAPQAGPEGSPLAWIDAPLDGSTLPLAPVEVRAHGADPSGVSQFEFSVDGSVVGTWPAPGAASSLTMIVQTWDPPAPGAYTLRVRVQNGSGGWSDYARVAVNIGGSGAVPAGPTPSPVPSQLPTGNASSFTLVKNANCRFGPGQAYEVLDAVLAGANVPVEGRNENKNWVYVRLPSNSFCWLSLSTGSLNGDINLVPFHPYPALPTATPTPVLGCYEYDQNQQLVCTSPCSPNAQPGGACTP